MFSHSAAGFFYHWRPVAIQNKLFWGASGLNVYRFINTHLQGDNAYNLENGVQSATVNSGHWASGVVYCSFLDVFTTDHHFMGGWGVGVYVKFRQRWGWAFMWTWAFAWADSVYIFQLKLAFHTRIMWRRYPLCMKNRNGFKYSDSFHVYGYGAGPECTCQQHA